MRLIKQGKPLCVSLWKVTEREREFVPLTDRYLLSVTWPQRGHLCYLNTNNPACKCSLLVQPLEPRRWCWPQSWGNRTSNRLQGGCAKWRHRPPCCGAQSWCEKELANRKKIAKLCRWAQSTQQWSKRQVLDSCCSPPGPTMGCWSWTAGHGNCHDQLLQPSWTHKGPGVLFQDSCHSLPGPTDGCWSWTAGHGQLLQPSWAHTGVFILDCLVHSLSLWPAYWKLFTSNRIVSFVCFEWGKVVT